MWTFPGYANFSPHNCAFAIVLFFARRTKEMSYEKITLHSEIVYLVAIILIALSVAMLTTSGYGLSMLVAPAYILSLILGIEFGIAEYIVQGALIVLFCIIVRRFNAGYLFSFISCLLYGAILIALQKSPFRHRCQPARKLRNVAKSASIYLRRFSHVLLRRTIFQGVFAPASLRLFRKRHK